MVSAMPYWAAWEQVIDQKKHKFYKKVQTGTVHFLHNCILGNLSADVPSVTARVHKLTFQLNADGIGCDVDM